MKKYKADNKGFSLVELIIAVAIISLFIGVAGYGLSLSSGKPAEECARKLAASLQHARTTTMGKYRNIVTISNDGGTIKVTEKILRKINDDGSLDEYERENIVGKKGVVVKYTAGGTATELTAGSSIAMGFDSGSGALKTMAPYTVCTQFEISKGGTTKTINIETLTGRVMVSD